MASRRKYSPLWLHFEDTGSKRAKCNYCSREIAVSKSSIGSLGRHLRTVHPEVNVKNVMQNTANSDSEDEENILDPDSELWGFFDKEPHNKAKCSMCGVNLSRDSDTLYSHLKMKHSKISQNLEFKENDESYTEVIYLEDNRTNNKNETQDVSETQEDRRKNSPKEKDVKKRPKELTKEDQEIEDFGKYITGLLKGIPIVECSQLQLDIVNMIMTAKLKTMKSVEPEKTEKKESRDEPIHFEVRFDDPTTIDITKIKPAIEEPDIHTIEKDAKLTGKDAKLTEKDEKLTEKDETQINDFGKYITSLLKCLHLETSAKLQMNIINLIIVTRLKRFKKGPILTIDGIIETEDRNT